MTTPPVERRRPTPLLRAAAAAAVSGALVVAVAAPAGAAWRPTAALTSGGLSLASIGSRLETRAVDGSTVPQGSEYSAAALLALGPALLDAVNTSSVPAAVTVTVEASGLANLIVTVKGCSVPWTAALTCASGETTASTAPVVIGSTSRASTSVVLPRGERRYLKVGTSLSVSAAATVTLRTSAAPSSTPRDRTSG